MVIFLYWIISRLLLRICLKLIDRYVIICGFWRDQLFGNYNV